MKRIGILYHPIKKAAYRLAKNLERFLRSKGISVWLCSAWQGERARSQISGTDLVLSIGGDGTILRVAHVVIPGSTPITGINLGRLGFMTELSADEAETKLIELLSGKGWLDERAVLEVELPPDQDGIPRIFYALNDIVVARGAISRIIHIEASINGELLTTYRADGVIAASATGSTGYSLAAGGPILHPQADELLLLPILPHLGSVNTLVVPSNAVIKLRISTTHEATLSVDGHINLPVSDGSTITVRHSSQRARFLRINTETSFYGSLEQRLKGKQ